MIRSANDTLIGSIPVKAKQFLNPVLFKNEQQKAKKEIMQYNLHLSYYNSYSIVVTTQY